MAHDMQVSRQLVRAQLAVKCTRHAFRVPRALFRLFSPLPVTTWRTLAKRGLRTYRLERAHTLRKRPLVTEPKWLSGNLQFPTGDTAALEFSKIPSPAQRLGSPTGRLNRVTLKSFAVSSKKLHDHVLLRERIKFFNENVTPPRVSSQRHQASALKKKVCHS